MKTCSRLMPLSACFVLALAVASPSLLAGEPASAPADVIEERRIVVAIDSDDFSLAETDVSHLAVGDAQTFVTDSGKTIDILRTQDGVEIYVDGDLVDGGHGADVHRQVIEKRVEVVCNTAEECDHLIVAGDGDPAMMEDLHEEHMHRKVIVVKQDDEDVY